MGQVLGFRVLYHLWSGDRDVGSGGGNHAGIFVSGSARRYQHVVFETLGHKTSHWLDRGCAFQSVRLVFLLQAGFSQRSYYRLLSGGVSDFGRASESGFEQARQERGHNGSAGSENGLNRWR